MNEGVLVCLLLRKLILYEYLCKLLLLASYVIHHVEGSEVLSKIYPKTGGDKPVPTLVVGDRERCNTAHCTLPFFRSKTISIRTQNNSVHNTINFQVPTCNIPFSIQITNK